MLDSATIVRRKPGLMASTLDGELVMLDIESGHYFGLSGVGPSIWHMLDQACSVGTIIEGVKAEFATGSADRVDEDVTIFLQQLVDKGLVMIVT